MSAKAAFQELIAGTWDDRRSGSTRPELQRRIESVVPGFSSQILETLIDDGVMIAGQQLTFADPQLAAWLFARWLHESTTAECVVESLSPDTDAEVLAEWLRLQKSPATIAADLVRRIPDWKAPVVHALSQCPSDNMSVLAALIGMARHDEAFSAHLDVCDAFGDFAMRSRLGWKWLVRLFISTDDDERSLAQRALWHVARFLPEQVAFAVRLSIKRHGLPRLFGEKDFKHRRKIAQAIRPLRNIDSRFAGEAVLRTLTPR